MEPVRDDNERLPSLDIDEAAGGSSSGLAGGGRKTSPLHASAADDGAWSSTNLPLLTACYLSALTTGATTYAFSFYSSALKSSLRLSQNQLDTLSSATFCAGVLSWMPGMCVDLWGARRAMVIGGTANSVHLTLYWFLATGRWRLDQEALILALSALGVVIFMGCAMITGSVFKVIVESCGAGSKGKAVGCAKGYVGVGSGVYVCLFGALFGPPAGGTAAGPGRIRGLASAATAALAPFAGTGTGSQADPRLLAGDEESDLTSLNFLLMAAVLSSVAATLPALLFLPRQQSRSSGGVDGASACQLRRDGTRSVHFRVIYAGLFLLGTWVVGVSLAELRDDRDSVGGGREAIDPSIANKTVRALLGRGADGEILDMDGDILGMERDSEGPFGVAIVRRLSAATPVHWGSVFFLLLLWWGPALSLLCIPPRKASASDPRRADPDGESFDYGSDEDDDVEEEETFLQDGEQPQPSALSVDKRRERDVGRRRREYTLTEMLRTKSCWLMAYTSVIIVGGGTVMTNNIGQMTEALGFDPDLTSASLALFSAAQGAGRVITGIFSELALKWEVPWFLGCCSSGGGMGVPRPVFLLLASLVSAASHTVLAATTTPAGFALGCTLSGFAFGMVWPMLVLLSGEVFGVANVGANYMFFDGFSSAVGTLLLSKFLAQEVYDEHIDESHHGDVAAADDDGFQCFGTGCFRASHAVVSMLSLTCIVSSICLVQTTRDVYCRPETK